jgi:hypothetical protein
LLGGQFDEFKAVDFTNSAFHQRQYIDGGNRFQFYCVVELQGSGDDGRETAGTDFHADPAGDRAIRATDNKGHTEPVPGMPSSVMRNLGYILPIEVGVHGRECLFEDYRRGAGFSLVSRARFLHLPTVAYI